MPQFQRGKPGVKRDGPAPTYDVVGWVTDAEAAEVRDQIAPSERGGKFRASTIGRWRAADLIQSFSVNGRLTLVNLEQVIQIEPPPQGKPVADKEPPKADPLPDTIWVQLRRRSGEKPPARHRMKPERADDGEEV